MRILKESARGLDKLDRHILRILQQDGRVRSLHYDSSSGAMRD